MLSKNERSRLDRDLDDLKRLADQLERRTRERDALLARLHAEGASIPELARAARMSVGKAHRLAKCELRTVKTIGYEGRSFDEFVDLVKTAGVDVVVDVRELPLSRKAGFSKTSLSAGLGGAGLEYVHLRGLGNPKSNREPFRAGRASALRTFENRLRSEGAADLERLRSLLTDRSPALLCFERDHNSCHRSLIADELQRGDAGLFVHKL